jgi:hypothetical protein
VRIRTALAALLVFAAFCPQVAYSQPPPDGKEEPPVIPLKNGWIKFGPDPGGRPRARRDYMEEALNEEYKKNSPNWRTVDEIEMARAGQSRAGGKMNPPKPYMYKVKVKNSSSKIAVAVKWTYVFLDPVTRKELLRHNFESKTKIPPGKEKELTTYTDAAPPSVVNAQAKAKKGKEWIEEVIIEKVQYADGTSWTRNDRARLN